MIGSVECPSYFKGGSGKGRAQKTFRGSDFYKPWQFDIS